MNPFIDYSQYYSWQAKCPAFWYERYVNKRQIAYPSKQRDDALAIGSLVHSGLQVWQESKQVDIPQSVIDEISPTKDALEACYQMVIGYAQRYNNETWSSVVCEEPIRFPLVNQTTWGCSQCGMEGLDQKDGDSHPCDVDWTHPTVWNRNPLNIDGLAKIDTYFYVDKLTQIESGIDGQTITLTPGWWIHEYKTKDAGIDLALYMKRWEVNYQASFQILALQHHVKNPDNHNYPYSEGGEFLADNVEGILVNIIEKPKLYIPKRKCPECNTLYEYSLWIPTGEGTHSCPVCGVARKLAKLKEDPVTYPPNYYRMVVTRSSEQLALHKSQIKSIALQMHQMRTNGLNSVAWNSENCVIPFKRYTCEYYNNHLNSNSTIDDPRFIQVDDYIKESVVEELV